MDIKLREKSNFINRQSKLIKVKISQKFRIDKKPCPELTQITTLYPQLPPSTSVCHLGPILYSKILGIEWYFPDICLNISG